MTDIERYRLRRAERRSRKRVINLDSVDAFKARRTDRMQSRMDIEWEENDHPRGKDGKFTSGGGSNGGNSNGNKNSNKENKNDKLKNTGNKPAKSVESVGSRYTASFKTGSGVDFPKPKKGAVYDEDTLKEVNRLAGSADKNQPPKAKEYDKIMHGMTEKNLTYQKDPDGTVVASIPGLSTMYDHTVKGKSPEVQAAYDKRLEGGKQITADMIKISDSLGSRMMGLENCFKGGESTSRKIDKVKEKFAKKGIELNDEQALAEMDDVVRFSYKCEHGKMVDQIKGLESELQKNGYEITERDNKFLPKEDGMPRDYKAVHLQVKAPSGELFEVQVQSEETIKVKNKNHSLYEQSRVLDDNDPKKAKLVNAMVDNWSGMAEPEGILNLPTFKKKK